MGDVDKDGTIDFGEFLNYCLEHEKKLRLVFQAMDTNKDGEWVWQRGTVWDVSRSWCRGGFKCVSSYKCLGQPHQRDRAVVLIKSS